jgi:FkbM family methyltransferase
MTVDGDRRSTVKRWAQFLCRAMASRPPTRRLLNVGYDFLPAGSKAAFHRLFTEIFREQDERLVEGEWHVRFNGTVIRLPLRPALARLDWTAAISILGHETEIKATYAHLLAERGRPLDVFLDVGANFGTHSILFAASGVKVVAFEPNQECRAYSAAVAALNHLEISWIDVALGDHDGEVNLHYPRTETWLGAIETSASGPAPGGVADRLTTRVRLDLLDRYAASLPAGARILLKIDVEGGELAVLRGARSLLQRTPAPRIIFETNDASGREDLADLLAGHGYRIFDLPFAPEPQRRALSRAEFIASDGSNFIAVADRP